METWVSSHQNGLITDVTLEHSMAVYAAPISILLFIDLGHGTATCRFLMNLFRLRTKQMLAVIVSSAALCVFKQSTCSR